MRWSEKETLKFVNIYLRYECLWNPNDEGYKCRDRRQIAYQDIINIFCAASGIVMGELELKSKIKNLRSTYIQELAKINQRSGPYSIYTPNIKWFNDWHKCFAGIRKRRRSGDLQQYTGDSLTPQVTGHNMTIKMETMENAVDSDENSSIKKKRIQHVDFDPGLQDVPTVNNVKEDEFDIYGKYIASQLRSMDLQRALKIQLEIHGIVNEARMSSLSDY